MSRKDYILIAAALKRAREETAAYSLLEQRPMYEAMDYAAVSVAHALARDNPRFDCECFLKAAGVQS